MTLRRKTFLTFGLTLAALVGALWALSRTVLLTGFAQVEENEARSRISQVQQLIVEELASLGAVAQDYSKWDVIYRFMETRDSQILDELPGAETTSLRVHFVALLDTSGKLVLGSALDLDNKVDRPLDTGLREALESGRLHFPAQGVTGIFSLAGGPTFIAAEPILTSEGQGPSRGLLVFGRRLDAWQWAKLSRETGLALVVNPAGDASLPADVRLSQGSPIQIARRDPDQLSAYLLLEDVAGRPALVLSAKLPRPVYAQARESVAYLAGWVFAIGLALGGVGLLLIETLTLSRLRRLTAGAQRIATTGDLSARLELAGSDELSTLAAALNRMLDALAGARDALQRSEERLRDIIEHSTNLFYSRAPGQDLTYMSPQARTFLDVDPEAPVKWTDLLTDNPINAAGLARGRSAIASGQREPPYELELRGSTGRRIWVEVNEAPVVRGGATVAVAGALTDITARRLAEADKAGLEEQLRQAQKMEAVGRLAGGVAHDFNNMLGVIGGYSELLALDLGAGHPGQPRLQQIQKATERAAALTRQLLAFGRKQLLQPTVLDLNGVVTNLEKMLHRLIGEDVELVTELEAGLGHVSADLGQIEQVLLNFVVNARDAMPTGGRIVVATASVTLDDGHAVAGAAPGRYVRLSVTDTGQGMDEATQARIFEPFFTTKELGKGTGLGLSTVFGIVKQSGGHIQVESRPGQGSTFHVYLPRVSAPVANRGAVAQDPTSVPRGSETVLLAEDEEALRTMLEEFLTDSGYTVVTVATPEEALRLGPAHPSPIHLLLTDVVMPGMSGRDMAARLKILRPEIRVLYMSGYTDEAMGNHGILGNGVHFIQKPFEPTVLLRKVRSVLDDPGPQQL